MIISTPSYIIPGTYLENVRHIAEIPEIQSVELLFFMYDAETDLLMKTELPSIQEYAGRLGFTLHMPDDVKPEHRIIIEGTKGLVNKYIIHPPTEAVDLFLSVLGSWIDEYGPVFLLENLIGREFELLLKREPRFGVCMDTGHLLVRGEEPAGFAGRYGDRIGEIHLHGVADGRDHNVLQGEEEWFQALLPFLRDFRGVCNIELFKESEVMEMLAILRGFSLM